MPWHKHIQRRAPNFNFWPGNCTSRAEKVLSEVPLELQNGTKNGFCAREKSLGVPTDHFCVPWGWGYLRPTPRRQNEIPKITFTISCAQKNSEGSFRASPRPCKESKSRKRARARVEFAFWCPRCARGLENGYIKSQKHLKATLTAQNE